MSKKPTMLVVDDEPKINKAYSEHFAHNGFEVSTAFDGQEGLALVKEKHPNIILLDVIMPVMDGLTMLEQLRSDPEFVLTPVIMLTNLDSVDSVGQAVASGVTHYLVKSNYSIEALDAKVQEVLKISAK